jgi:predicted dehydrogenase
MEPKSDLRSACLNRRDLLKAAAAGGFSLMVSGNSSLFAEKTPKDAINAVLIGAGTQGNVIVNEAHKIPGVNIRAVCDIWPFRLKRAGNLADKWQESAGLPKVGRYEDYREMLAKEKDLQAAIVATPDWMHAEHTIACLKAGLHVYCEKEMSNDLTKAKEMVQTAKATGKLLQIGHQRRSNARYLHAEKLLRQEAILGRITHAFGQWNRGEQKEETTGAADPPSEETLKKYGYENVRQFCNWRWFKKYGGGPIVDLGSHQIDIFSWFLGCNPKSVWATGGVDYYKDREWYDNVMSVFEFATPTGVTRLFYQQLNTTSCLGYFETFMGVDGTLSMSEAESRCRLYSEGRLPDNPHPWQKWAAKGLIVRVPEKKEDDPNAAKVDEMTRKILALYKPSPPPVMWYLGTDIPKDLSYHGPHVKNFFDAIRDNKVKLNCPAEVAYETAVAVLTVNKAVAGGQKIEFQEADFKA